MDLKKLRELVENPQVSDDEIFDYITEMMILDCKIFEDEPSDEENTVLDGIGILIAVFRPALAARLFRYFNAE